MGSGFKDFAAGDILTAADVDGYLMRQTVMTFADASARDTALSGVLDEGMVAYLEDTNAVTVYNGSAWVAVIDSDVLTVDTANNRVGVNDSTPSYALDVTGDINASGNVRVNGTAIGTWTSTTPEVRQPSAVGFSGGYAEYSAIGDVVHFRARLQITGTGTTNNIIKVTLPFGSADTVGTVGVGRIIDSGARYDTVIAEVVSATEIAFVLTESNTTQNYGQNPNMALASGDEIWFSITYRKGV